MAASISPLQRSDMLMAVVHQLRWYPGRIAIGRDEVTMEGWALSAWEGQDQLRFLVNGEPFEEVQYLRQRFSRTISSFESILDWGCGAGRLSRYLCRMSSRVTGIDIDADNIAMCARTLPWVRTHLEEPRQPAWLAELRRIARPGCILSTWADYFDVLEIVPALGCPQDSVVLRARER